MTTYYRRVLTLEILSDRRTDELSMADLAYEITDGDASGAFLSDTTTEIGPDAMIGLLIAQGSDPEFLLGNNDDDGTLTWLSAMHDDEPRDQNADTRALAHGYWSLGPTVDDRWSVELIEQNESLDQIGTAFRGRFTTEDQAKVAAQVHENSYDTASSASRQYFIETGRYLRHGEALDDDDARLIRKFNDDEVPVQDDVWNNDLVQFARLLAEIVANQDDLDIDALCESMDLPASRVHELLDRADTVWNNAKTSRSFGDVA